MSIITQRSPRGTNTRND